MYVRLWLSVTNASVENNPNYRCTFSIFFFFRSVQTIVHNNNYITNVTYRKSSIFIYSQCATITHQEMALKLTKDKRLCPSLCTSEKSYLVYLSCNVYTIEIYPLGFFMLFLRRYFYINLLELNLERISNILSLLK